MVNHVIILRGIPGSGKSTWCTQNYPHALICSADHFFIDPATLEYKFNPAWLPKAHASCFRKFIEALSSDAPINNLIVDNTNIRATEIAPYVAAAQAYDTQVRIITLTCDPNLATQRNVHGVSSHAVKSMDERLSLENANFPPWWVHEVY